MLKTWHFKYAFLMSALLSMTVVYNNCSNDANFDLSEGVESIETFVGNGNENGNSPSIVINNGAAFTQDVSVNLSLNAGALADQMNISETSDCSGGQWEPYQDNRLWNLSQGNQTASVYVKYRYQDEPESACVKDDIVHDDIPPTVSFNQNPGDWIAEANINIGFTALDSGSGVRQTECDQAGSGQFQACGKSVFFNGMIENQIYQLNVRAQDNAGNMSAPQALSWRSDQTPPTVAFNSTPSALTADVTPDFIFVGTDLGSGVDSYECRVDQAATFSSCTSPMTLSNLADGPHQIQVRAIDRVGRISQPVAYSWTQDTQAPTIQFTQTPQSLANSAAATFAFQGINGAQGIVSYRCRLDNGAYQTCTSPRNLSNLSDGNHSFSVIGTDGVGNNSSPITYSWQIDTVNPTISFVSTPPAVGNSNQATVSMQAQDLGSGIREIRCRLDGGAMAPCANSISWNNLGAGSHTVYAQSVDQAGNLSNLIQYTWVIDLSGPVVAITSHPTNPTGDAQAAFTFTATDAGSGIDNIECRIDGAPYSVCASPMNYTGLTEGQHIFSVRATDNAGNLSNVSSYTWLSDQSGPSLEFTLQPEAVVPVGGDARVRFVADDGNGSGVASYQCLINGAPIPCAGDTTYAYPAVQDGQNFAFQVTATDAVGNATTRDIAWVTAFNVVPRQTEYMIEQDRPVDILFVVDNSGSMNAERANLAQRIDGFMNRVAGLDWQIAVTSTDISGSRDFEEGRLTAFSPNLHILDSSMNQQTAQQLFGARVQGMPNGSGAEQGIFATVKMIERALDGQGSNANNAAFIRSNADLAVVILSDEDENSNGANVEYTPAQFLSFVDTNLPGKNITWHSIVTMSGDTACKNSGYSYYGVNYEELSRLTGHGQPGGAIIGSVCAASYTDQLQDIGQSVRDMQKTLSLECEPVDNDNDGTPDMEVLLRAPGANDYTPYNGSFVIQARKIVFDDFLPVGDYRLNYYCSSN